MPTLKEKLQRHYMQSFNLATERPSIFTASSIKEYVELDMYLGDGKQRILLENVFAPLDDDHEMPSKVLIEGGAGMGKSTTIERLSFLWGNEEILGQFNYVFKINLELLLDKAWKEDYGAYIQQNPLACLVHYSLEQSIRGRGAFNLDYITVDEIIELFAQEEQIWEVLLLADGYDKIAHLVGNKAVKNMLDNILEFDNVY